MMRRCYINLKVLLAFLLIGVNSLSATISTPYGSQIEAVIFDCDGGLSRHRVFKVFSMARGPCR